MSRLSRKVYRLSSLVLLRKFTTAKTSLKKWNHAVSKFIAIIPCLSICQMSASGLYLSLKKKESKNGCMAFTSSASSWKEEVRQFCFAVVQRRQEQKRDARGKSLFCQSNPIAFLPVFLLSLYMYVWIHRHYDNKKPLNLKPILLVTMLLWKAESTWLCIERVSVRRGNGRRVRTADGLRREIVNKWVKINK